MKKGRVVFTQSTEIIGVVKEGIIVEGYFDDDYDDEDGDDVKLLITKEQYFTLLNDWMTEKQDYCDRYGHMCGHGNFIVYGNFDEVTMLGEEMLDGRMWNLDDIDMEHG